MGKEKAEELEQFIKNLSNATLQEKAETYIRFELDVNLVYEISMHPNKMLMMDYYKIMKPIQHIKCVNCLHTLREHISVHPNAVNEVRFLCIDGTCDCGSFSADNLTWLEREAIKNNLTKEDKTHESSRS